MNDDPKKQDKEIDPGKQAEFQRRFRAFEARVRTGQTPYDNAMHAMQLVLDSKTVAARSLLPSPAHQLRTAKMLSQVMGWDAGLKIRLNEIDIPRLEASNSLKPTQAYILDLWLGDEYKTFAAAWNLVLHALPSKPLYLLDLVPISIKSKQCNDSEYARWRLVDFSNDTSEKEAVDTSDRLPPGTVIMWAMVYNPMLLDDLMKLYAVEYLSLAGVECENPDNFFYLAIERSGGVKLAYTQKSRGHQSQLCYPRFID